LLVKSAEPQESDGEMDEAHVGNGKFVVPGGDSTVVFDSLKEVFDHVASPIAAAGKLGWIDSIAPRRNTRSDAACAQPMTEGIAVIAFVSHEDRSRYVIQNGLSVGNVCFVAGTEEEAKGSARLINHGVDLGVESAFGAPERLMFPASGGIGCAAMRLDVSSVDIPLLALGGRAYDFPQNLPQTFFAPSSIVLKDGIPVRLWTINRSPFAALAEDDENAAQH
jgi:hypothetical protein